MKEKKKVGICDYCGERATDNIIYFDEGERYEFFECDLCEEGHRLEAEEVDRKLKMDEDKIKKEWIKKRDRLLKLNKK